MKVLSMKSKLGPFRSQFSEDIFCHKYAHAPHCHDWYSLCNTLVLEVCGEFLNREELAALIGVMSEMKFIPGGRYLYYAGRERRFYNNCYLLRAMEDTREDWASLMERGVSCLMTGGGIGADYSIYRPSNMRLGGTGGFSSGPLPAMMMMNENGRNVMQGGSRRSAIYASLNWRHGDIQQFLVAKNWHEMKVPGTDLTIKDLKDRDFNWPAPLDMTNISTNYDTEWLLRFFESGDYGDVFRQNVRQAMQTAEPGFSFNFFDKEFETLRNACTEVTSEDDSDVCNLGSVNMGRIDSPAEFREVCELATLFLMCGLQKADLPYQKVKEVREKNSRIGLGLMGMHEWLLKKGYKYEVTPELHKWLTIYRGESDRTARNFAKKLGIAEPVAKRAIAPTGTIGILAGTSTGIEPLLAVAYKRRYLKGKSNWVHQYAIEPIAQEMIDLYGVEPDSIESSIDLAADPVRRIKFQADVQDYVDMAISSTINLPPWGSEFNNEDRVEDFAKAIAEHASRLRGLTFYPDGSRGGQPITSVPYDEAKELVGEEFSEALDVCDITGKGGTCGS